jgi:hypothetical protein
MSKLLVCPFCKFKASNSLTKSCQRCKRYSIYNKCSFYQFGKLEVILDSDHMRAYFTTGKVVSTDAGKWTFEEICAYAAKVDKLICMV